MAHEFSYIDDFPEYFYYGDLLTALKDLRLSDAGIGQIMGKRSLTEAKDRDALLHILIRMIADLQKPASVIDLVWEHVLARLRGLGFSDKGLDEIANSKPITLQNDREVLLTVLYRWLVRNESRVPQGLPGHLRVLWKQKQLEKQGKKP